MRNVGIVLAYGIFIPPNTEYQSYLEKAFNFCLQDATPIIITTGGYTNKKYPEISEASSVAKLFSSLHPDAKPAIFCEDKSLTTIQNLEFSCDYLKTSGQAPEKLTIICDSIRLPKILYSALDIFSDLLGFKLSKEERLNILLDLYLEQDPNLVRDISFAYKNLEIKGIPLSQSAEIVSYQIISSMWEMHALEYPKLHQKFIAWRKQKWEIK